MTIAISVENISKTYRLGTISGKTLTDDVHRWWAKLRGKPDPLLKIGATDHGNQSGDYIWALRDVSFQVPQGQALGIIGRNGAGKSTLLKILSRVTAPTAGEIKVRGRIASLLEVGTGFHPELTGRENIFLNGAILGMRRAEIQLKLDEIIDFSGVEKFIDTPVKRYSSGMFVRLAFAVAAHLEPEILVVDEVLAVGDIEFQKKCLGKMSDVMNAGRTVLFVSHNMAAVRKLCPFSMMLDKGVFTMLDRTNTVIDRYIDAMGSSSKSVVELPLINGFGADKGQGLRLLISDESGQPRNKFKIGEKWLIRLEFEIHQNLKHVIAGIGLVTRESIPLVTYWSKPADLAPGRYYTEFVCDLPLKATLIDIIVGLSEYERSFYHVQDVTSLEIVQVSDAEKQPIRASGAGLLLGNQHSDIYSF
ncbi:MAG: polysaccharide ABC transporter ATP-binding protein [Thermodesulfobacteriota bacterium]